MCKTDCKHAEGHGCPAVGRRLIAEALGVDEGNDRERSAAVGQIDAAHASVVLNQDAKEVLVGDALCMGRRLHTLHHEAIFRGDGLSHTMLLLLCHDIILDF